MAKDRTRRPSTGKAPSVPTPFDEARDELFQHIMRCGVIDSTPDHQSEWFNETMTYMTDRYPELSEAQITELRTLGSRFAQPAKGKATSAA